MANPLTSLSLMLLTVLAGVAAAVAVRRLRAEGAGVVGGEGVAGERAPGPRRNGVGGRRAGGGAGGRNG
ncbi:MAG: hypothetical protein AAF797_17410, partial [Planctomycetota bacterium]